MAFNFDTFEKKAKSIIDLHDEAEADGRRLGCLQDLGIFLNPDAPAHIRNQIVPLPTQSEWQALMDKQIEDPLIRKFGPGVSIMNLYYNAAKGVKAEPGDAPSPLMAKATPRDLDRLWTEYFKQHPDPSSRVGTKLFIAAMRVEATKRGLK